MNKLALATGLAALTFSATAWSSGFEKSIMFGGKTSGIAGIGTPQMQGGEALYFNPAGLATDKEGKDFTLNVSPTMPKFKAPISAANSGETSAGKTLLPGALFYGQSLNDKLGIGAGYYVSGGTDVKYENVTFAGVNNGTGEADTKLNLTEFALGAGYKVNENLKVGLSYRISMVDANFKLLQRTSASSFLQTNVDDLKATNFMGFKLGAQYKLSDSTNLGFTYRSNVPFKAKGKVGGKLQHNTLGALPVTSGDMDVQSTFPDAYTLGVQHRLSDTWTLFGEYVYTAYGRIKNIQLEGTIAVEPTGTTGINQTNKAIQMNWKDQTNIRLAAENTSFGAPIRFGYIWTSRVTEARYARHTFPPPGEGHTVTLGSGMNFNESFSLNGGIEYTKIAGSSQANAADGINDGDFTITETAVHLGATYSF